MLSIENIIIFVKVVQLGSFSKAAYAMKLPTSTVSRRIMALELQMSAKLLFRTTRSVTLTITGRAFYERVLNPILELEEAHKDSVDDGSVSGHIKLTATEDEGALVITPIIGRLMSQFPKLIFELYYTSEVVDLVKGGYDLALRIGSTNASNFKSIHVGNLTLIAVASPRYLDKGNEILHPKDLASCRCLTFGPATANAIWTFSSKEGKVNAQVKSYGIANQMQSLATLASLGGGVAFVPHFVAAPLIDSEALIRVLPSWTVKSYKVHLVSPHTAAMPARVRIVADAISSSVRELLEMC